MVKKILVVLNVVLLFSWSLWAKDTGNVNNDVANSHVSKDYVVLSPSTSFNDALDGPKVMRPQYYNRDTADTMALASEGWGGQFIQSPNDAMLVVFQLPADATIKGVNVPVYAWGTGDQQMTVGLYRVSYPLDTDGNQYSADVVNGDGWIGGYDLDATTGDMSFMGDTYTPGGTVGVCNTGTEVAAGAQDPLGTELSNIGPAGIPKMGLAWPDGFLAATLDPTNNPDISTGGGGDNWIATADFGTEPTFVQGEYVGILVYSSGAGGGDDDATGFLYQDGGVLGLNNPWSSLKFYGGDCNGTSGNDGWHIRGWAFDFELAVLLTGDRAPVISDQTVLATTLSTAARAISANVTDDNPAGGDAGVASVEAMYTTDGGSTWNSVALTGSGDVYSGEIPGQSQGTWVEYYYKATDVLDNVSETPHYTYQIFAPVYPNLFSYNSSEYSDFIKGYYLYGATGITDDNTDWWNFGAGTSELFDNYTVIIEMTGGGPDWIDNPADLKAWVEGGGDLILAGDEWLGAQSGWTDSCYVAGSVQYDLLGIDCDHNDINYLASGDQGEVSRLLTVSGDAISGDLDDFLADSLDLNYDPNYELGFSNWLDGVTPQAGVDVAVYAVSGVLDANGDPTGTDTIATGIYHDVLPSSEGGKVAFFGFDPLATNTTPSYYWIGIQSFGILPKAIDWINPLSINPEDPSVPNDFVLNGNYPNPFNPSTTISFTLGRDNDVTVKVYSLLGEEVATLTSGRMNKGLRTVQWNGLDNNGKSVSTGIYLYQVKAGNQTLTGKMTLLK